MLSIVIPAYNEEMVIDRCLSALIDTNEPCVLDIIVVCNGCDDQTAKIAAKIAPEATILYLEKASKSAAINIGLQNCKHKEVIILDADIIFSLNQLWDLLRYAQAQKFLAISPAVDIDLLHACKLNRAYYRVAERLPYLNQFKLSHVIYLTEPGCARLGIIPEIIADDLFIRSRFTDKEISICKDISYTLTAPKSYSGLIKILSRSHLGNVQFQKQFSEDSITVKTGHLKALARLALIPRLLPSVIVFIMTKLIVRCRVILQLKNIEQYEWEKDDSSRTIN